jgi:hypothetical protein
VDRVAKPPIEFLFASRREISRASATEAKIRSRRILIAAAKTGQDRNEKGREQEETMTSHSNFPPIAHNFYANFDQENVRECLPQVCFSG